LFRSSSTCFGQLYQHHSSATSPGRLLRMAFFYSKAMSGFYIILCFVFFLPSHVVIRLEHFGRRDVGISLGWVSRVGGAWSRWGHSGRAALCFRVLYCRMGIKVLFYRVHPALPILLLLLIVHVHPQQHLIALIDTNKESRF
jgi:hypothetical protein